MHYSDKHPNLKKLEQQIEELRLACLTSFFFRGQANCNWHTTSTLVRNNDGIPKERLIIIEKQNVEDYRNKTADIFNYPNNVILRQWYWIMQAQHSGIHTRLLDWTPDWVRALFFLLDGAQNDEEDGAILYTNTRINTVTDGDLMQIDPYKNDQFLMLCPAVHHTDDFPHQLGMTRISRQIGKFLLAPVNQLQVPLENTYSDYLGKLIVSSADKISLRKELEDVGVTYNTIYHPVY